MFGLLGEKLGMTHVFKDGEHVAVTVVKVTPNHVLGVKEKTKHGYEAVLVGAGAKKESRYKKPVLGQLKKNQLPLVATQKEFRTGRAGEYKVGMQVGCAQLAIGDVLDAQAISKGRGFQGVMKRHNFAGGRDSHGCSLSHRVPGSIGQRTYPGRVIKGKKMPGQMGNVVVTVRNLEVVAVEPEQNLVLIRGTIPGAKNGQVVLSPKSAEFENRILAVKGA